jgi:hypothetical protein
MSDDDGGSTGLLNTGKLIPVYTGATTQKTAIFSHRRENLKVNS